MILTKLILPSNQFTQLFAVRFIRFCVNIEIHGYSQLDLFVSFYSYFYEHEVLFWKLQFTRLDLCVALGNSIHSDLNLYAVLTVFMQTSQFKNFAAQRG